MGWVLYSIQSRLLKQKLAFYFESIGRMFIVNQSPTHLLDLRADSPTEAHSPVCNGEQNISAAATHGAPQDRIFRIFWIYPSQKNFEMPSNINAQGKLSKLILKEKLLFFYFYTSCVLA